MNTLTQEQVQNLQFGDVVRLRPNGNSYCVDSSTGRHLQLRNLMTGRTVFHFVENPLYV